MKKECEEKLKLCKKLLFDSQTIGPSEEAEKMFDEGYALMQELIQTRDTNVLSALMELFYSKDIEINTGICETLESEIFQNYTMEQVIEALYKKFPELVANNEMRAEHFAGACISRGYFEEFRNVFNSTHTFHYENFFAELSEWIGEDYPEEISILRKDMEAWPKK